MRACATALSERIAAVLDPAGEVRQLAAIRPDQPLAARLTEVVGVLDAHARRVRAV
jgi:hypothetical protein